MTVLMFLVLFSVVGFSQQKTDEKDIERTILLFAKLGDQQDADGLENLLDTNFRIVMNQLFGSEEIMVMSREVYLGKIRKKEFGGDQRKVRVHHTALNGNIAASRVSYEGEKNEGRISGKSCPG